MRILLRCDFNGVDASGSLIEVEVFLDGKRNGLLVDHPDDLLGVGLLWPLKDDLLLKTLRDGVW
jgi:hypothetical protein